MQIENSFPVGAPPDRVYAFLLDVNRVVACVPGAELSEVVDPTTFKGRVRIKVGPVTVAYNGTAQITERDDQARHAVLQAEGRETTGSGSARATTTMTVTPEDAGSTVRLATDFTVVGRVAQFGRGIMEEVSRKLVGQMAECIRTKLEADEGATQAAEASAAPATAGARARAGSRRAPASRAAAGAGATATEESTTAARETSAPAAGAASAAEPHPAPVPDVAVPSAVWTRSPDAAPPPAAVPVDALALARSVAADRLRNLDQRRVAGIAAAVIGLLVLLRLLRRR
jgi:carbon monoxide dehydrogenase subunit G